MDDRPAVPSRLMGFHHVAFRCRDAEETRRFYGDLLGLPLAAGFSFDKVSGTQAELRYLHVFFELGDGRFLAFFDAPDSATEEHFRRRSGFNRHVAIEAPDLPSLEAWRLRLLAHGVEVEGPLDHGFVQSIYFFDPNGLNVEITARVPAHDAILAEERTHAAAELARWTERTRTLKRERGLRDDVGPGGRA